jgi:chromosome partitioning protein
MFYFTLPTLCEASHNVGKTTTALNMGMGLARQGKKVLLIDLDPQSNLTMCMGYQQPEIINYTIADIMTMIIEDQQVNINEGILTHPEGAYLMPSNIQLSGMEATLVNTMSRENILRTYINEVKSSYDYIIIDCMPSLGMLTINALAASDKVIIPVQPHFLSVKGLELLLKNIGKVRKQINPKLEVEGILLTMKDNRANFTRDISELLREQYGNNIRVFASEIPVSIKAVEHGYEGVSIYSHDPKGKISSAYTAFLGEILGKPSKSLDIAR